MTMKIQTTLRRLTGLGLLTMVLLFADNAARADTADLYRQSYVSEARGDFQAALGRMHEIRKAEGSSYFVSLRTGWLAYLAGDLQKSEDAYREAVVAKPAALEAKLGLTLVLFVAKRWKALETACKQALAEDPKHPALRARLAAAYYATGNYPDAAAVYGKLLEAFPGDLDYQTGYAWALSRMGKREEALKLFHAVLAVSPDNLNALQGLAAK
jgi:tetratricopeptide (TPR) repeat protein